MKIKTEENLLSEAEREEGKYKEKKGNVCASGERFCDYFSCNFSKEFQWWYFHH